jgi:hypothetical protein
MLRGTGIIALAALLLIEGSRPAAACGGGLVSRTPGVVADAQRVLVSVRGDKTDIVTQVTVPRGEEPFGIIIPLPAFPEIDATPFPAAALDQLDRTTTPQVVERSGGGGGFGCAGSASKGDSRAGGVNVGRQVEIGPVTAVSITASSSGALEAWLSQNGFDLDAPARAVVADYVAPGRAFIALKRSSTAGTAATSVGIHFSLPGDHRSLPLRFARIGAASKVAFTIFIFAPAPSGPALPIQALTHANLDPDQAASS